jgi:probable O-glycosylation ligase (exosortase A-associated)
MRDLALVILFIAALPATMVRPFVGVLVWTCLAVMNPHREVYSFAVDQPFNLIIAVVTVGAWLISREKKALPADAVVRVMLAFVLWMTFNSFFAFDPDWSWPLWGRTVKIFAFTFLVVATLRNKVRIHALVWMYVLCISYYGVKGGLFTVVSGGSSHVYGPENTILNDNNHLAVAVCCILPMLNYLRLQSAKRIVRTGLLAAMVIQIFSVLGSYSRGGVISLACCLGFFWMRSKRKILYLVIGLLVIVPALSLMPDSFYERMHSIEDAGQDDSFMGRVTSWQVCFLYAIDHFPFGAGFAGTQLSPIYHFYFPDQFAHAAHSIYFQVLGEHGFIGLALYLAMIVLSLRECRLVERLSRDRMDLVWANDLAKMTRISLFTFYIGAGALSMAYYDGFLIQIAIMVASRALIRAMPVPVPPAASPEQGYRMLEPVQ